MKKNQRLLRSKSAHSNITYKQHQCFFHYIISLSKKLSKTKKMNVFSLPYVTNRDICNDVKISACRSSTTHFYVITYYVFLL